MHSHRLYPEAKSQSLDNRRRRNRPRLTLALALALLATCVAAASRPGPASAGGARQEEEAPRGREFKDRVPGHVPIKVKVRKPEKVGDVDNEGWLGDLEVEVRNTGTKPIYFLRLGLSFADVRNKDSGNRMGYTFVYGRVALIDLTQPVLPEDVPIPPGGTHVFTVHEVNVRGWRWYRTKIDPGPQPRKIEIIFSALSHGDGTGYLSSDGRPVAVPVKRSADGVVPRKSGEAAAGPLSQSGCPPGPAGRASVLTMPAASLPVSFLSFSLASWVGSWGAAAEPAQSCCSGVGISCSRVKLVPGGNCFCPDAPPENGVRVEVDNFQCTDPQAACQIAHYDDTTCGEGETLQICQEILLTPCGSPTPAPPPPPPPPPTPDERTRPNPTNCSATLLSLPDPTFVWVCNCGLFEEGVPADYTRFPAGCEPDAESC